MGSKPIAPPPQVDAEPQELDWGALKLEFIVDPARPTAKAFAQTKGINPNTLCPRASRERWLALRDEHWLKVGTKVEEKISDYQAAEIARDHASALEQIQDLKARAVQAALGNTIKFKSKGEAVTAYARLVTLERLIVGEVTERSEVRQVDPERRRLAREAADALTERWAGTEAVEVN